MSTDARIVPIERRHDRAMARVIRDVMSEFEAEGPGFSRDDPEVDHLTDAYAAEGAEFWVIEIEDGDDAVLRSSVFGGSVRVERCDLVEIVDNTIDGGLTVRDNPACSLSGNQVSGEETVEGC